jgi:hypothetical protein
MALDISRAKARLHSLSNANSKQNLIWKPKPGKQVIRIVPYHFNPEQYSFIELKFHYGLNNKTYLSPSSFNRPDPIVEWCDSMIKSGNSDDWKLGKKMTPKMRTYAPILVRGEENLGVRYWGFGKQVYEILLKTIVDPDFGDITNIATGHDITVEYEDAPPSGVSFAKTSITIKPKPSPAIDEARKEILENQTNILDLFPEYTYEELRKIMDQWLAPEAPTDAEGVVSGPNASPTAAAAASTGNVDDQLHKLFAN